jgi:hypothetical protein
VKGRKPHGEIVPVKSSQQELFRHSWPQWRCSLVSMLELGSGLALRMIVPRE